MSRDESTSEGKTEPSHEEPEVEGAQEPELDLQPGDTAEFTEQKLTEARGADPEDPVAAWLEALDSGTENDTMLRFTPSQHNAIDLTEANSSGLMQLLAGRKTRLSTLLNESGTFPLGREAARGIRSKIREMSEDRGIDVGFMAAGIASWTETTEAGAQQFTAPVMLVPVTLRPRPDDDDDEVQFNGSARLNPALARHMQTYHGLRLDPEEFHDAGYAIARFDPVRTADLLSRVAGENLDSLQVWRQNYISTFADLADLGDPSLVNREHPVLRALATSDRLAEEPVEPQTLDERYPRTEKLVLDADPDQQTALDAIEAGTSLVISAPPGGGQTQTAVNAVAALAWTGKRTLVVAERTEPCDLGHGLRSRRGHGRATPSEAATMR